MKLTPVERAALLWTLPAFQHRVMDGEFAMAISHTIEAAVAEKSAEVENLLSQVERLRVQLAGCATAAQGHTSGEHVATDDMYGWSPAYEDVLRIRRKPDRYRKTYGDLN